MTDTTWLHDSFEKEKNYWISQIGPIHLGSEAEIKLVLYELKSHILPKDFNFTYQETVFKSKKEMWLPISLLVEVSTGSFICKNKLVSPLGKPRKIKSPEFSYRGKNPLSIRNLWDFRLNRHEGGSSEKEEILSFGFAQSGASGTPCIYTTQEDEIFVVPLIEVFRFYFCTSTTLTDELFTSWIDEDRIIHQEETKDFGYYKNDGTDYLHIRKNMVDTDLMVIARMAFINEAYEAARYALNSVRNSQDRRENDKKKPSSKGGFLKTYLPFKGTSNWMVNAIPMGVPNGGEFKGVKLFLVSRILSCDNSFLPSGFLFNRDNDNRQCERENAKERKRTTYSPNKTVGDLEIDLAEGNNPDLEKLVKLVNNDRFLGGPANGLIRRIERDPQKTKSKTQVVPKPSGKGSSPSNESDHDSPSGKGNIQTNLEDELVDSNDQQERNKYLHAFRDMAIFFGGQYKVDFSTMHFNPGHFQLKRKAKHFRNFATAGKNFKKIYVGRREVLALRVEYPSTSSYFYILDIMPRKNTGDQFTKLFVLAKNDFSEISNETFDEIFVRLTLNKKKSKKMNLPASVLPKIHRAYFEHVFPVRWSLITRILEKVDHWINPVSD